MRVADQLVEMLVNAGVKRVYAITGDSLNPVNDAIRKNGKIEWIHVRHEEAAAYAASMDAELYGIGCCMGSSGPGHVHLVNGLYDANRAENPVIAIASTCESYYLGREYFQGTDVKFLFKDCSKYVEVASTPKQFAHYMQGAIQTAISRRGVAVVGLPGDLAYHEAVDVKTSMKNFFSKPVIRPNDEELKSMADILNSSKKITFYCGHGCKDAVDEVMQAAQILKAPIAYTFRGKIFFDFEENEYRAGMNGLLGYKSGYDACNECDTLVMLGCDFPFNTFLPSDKTIIQVDHKARKLGRRANLTLGLQGNVKDTLKALIPMLKENQSDEFLKHIQKEFKHTVDAFFHYVKHRGHEDYIQPEYVAHVVNELADDDAIFTCDTGMNTVWAARFINRKRNRYLTGSFNHGSMANAMPMAMGAAAGTKRQVIAFSGDGGLSMLMGELATIAQYKLPVKIILFDNRSLGMVKLEMEVAGLIDWQTDMVNPDFNKLLDAMGIKNFVAHKPCEVEEVIKNTLSHDGPALANIFTTPDALSMPPHPDLEQMRGFMKSMFKKSFSGSFKDVIETGISNIAHLKEIF